MKTRDEKFREVSRQYLAARGWEVVEGDGDTPFDIVAIDDTGFIHLVDVFGHVAPVGEFEGFPVIGDEERRGIEGRFLALMPKFEEVYAGIGYDRIEIAVAQGTDRALLKHHVNCLREG